MNEYSKNRSDHQPRKRVRRVVGSSSSSSSDDDETEAKVLRAESIDDVHGGSARNTSSSESEHRSWDEEGSTCEANPENSHQRPVSGAVVSGCCMYVPSQSVSGELMQILTRRPQARIGAVQEVRVQFVFAQSVGGIARHLYPNVFERISSR